MSVFFIALAIVGFAAQVFVIRYILMPLKQIKDVVLGIIGEGAIVLFLSKMFCPHYLGQTAWIWAIASLAAFVLYIVQILARQKETDQLELALQTDVDPHQPL